MQHEISRVTPKTQRIACNRINQNARDAAALWHMPEAAGLLGHAGGRGAITPRLAPMLSNVLQRGPGEAV